jgi:hypothetical protein
VASAILPLLLIPSLLWTTTIYQPLYNRAFTTFKNSRETSGMPIDSYEFITRGILHGMSTSEVDRLMKGANDRSGVMYQVEPILNGRVSSTMYTFEYKPVATVPLLGTRMPLIVEWYRIDFNEQGEAIRLRRTLYLRNDLHFRAIRYRTGTSHWDLQERAQLE